MYAAGNGARESVNDRMAEWSTHIRASRGENVFQTDSNVRLAFTEAP